MATYFWVGGSGTWNNSNTTNWSATSGGAGGAGVPNSADVANFDVNSGTTATVTVASTATAGRTIINKSDINISLAGNVNLAVANAFTFTSGTLTLNNNTLTCIFFSSSNSNVRAIAFGTGKIIITGNNVNVLEMFDAANYSYTGTPRFELSYSGSVGTRGVRFGDNTNTANANNVPDIYVTAGSDIFRLFTNVTTTAVRTLDTTGFSGSISTEAFRLFGSLNLSATTTISATASAISFISTSAGNTITTNGVTINRPITFNGIGGSWAFQDALTQGSTRAFTITNGTVQLKAGATSTVGAFATSGTNQKFLQSTLAGTQATLSQASGTISARYLTVKDINAAGGATWNAFYSNGNSDAGNNTGWNFGGTPAVSTEVTYSLRSFTTPRRF